MTVAKKYFVFSGANFTHLRVYEISLFWFAGLALLTCMLLGTLVSFFTSAQDPRKLNPKLISPAVALLARLIPEPIAKFFPKLELGSDYVSTILNDMSTLVSEMSKVCNKNLDRSKLSFEDLK